jgi:hypothetical protein
MPNSFTTGELRKHEAKLDLGARNFARIRPCAFRGCGYAAQYSIACATRRRDSEPALWDERRRPNHLAQRAERCRHGRVSATHLRHSRRGRGSCGNVQRVRRLLRKTGSGPNHTFPQELLAGRWVGGVDFHDHYSGNQNRTGAGHQVLAQTQR